MRFGDEPASLPRPTRRGVDGGHAERMRTRHRASVVVYAVTCALVLTVIALGSLETMVWSPLAMTDPQYDLGRIYAIVGPVTVVGTLVSLWVWAALGIGVTTAAGLLLLQPRRPAPPLAVIAVGTALLLLGSFARFWAGFRMGNTVSDEVPPYRGLQSPMGELLYGFGAAMLPVLAVVGVVAVVRALPSGRPTR